MDAYETLLKHSEPTHERPRGKGIKVGKIKVYIGSSVFKYGG